MIYELRVYTLHPGRMKEYLKTFEENLPIREKHSKLAGLWYTEVGQLNQVFNLWGYRDLSHREAVRNGIGGDPDWQKVVARLLPMIVTMKNCILVPADFSPIK